MWSRDSHTLAHLTSITSSKVKFKWTKIEQGDFDEIERILACNVLLTYPDFNEEFKIYTNARYFQLKAVISQKGEPISFYSRKFTGEQKRCTVT